MKRALVLSGGGARGAYQIGVWRALRKLKIKIDIVTGTSVGALNGAFIVQDDFNKAYNIWRTIDYKNVFPQNYQKLNHQEPWIKQGYKLLKVGNQEAIGIEKLVDDSLDLKKFYQSTIDFGISIAQLPTLKPLYLTKKEIPSSKIKDYLVSSATVFPVFQPKKVDNKSLIDGAYYDNLPINLAIEMGADEIIAVDLGSIGRILKVKDKKIKVIMIKPSNKLDFFLDFDQEPIKRAMALGYNDTMKKFKKLDGTLYTFKYLHLQKNYQTNVKNYQNILKNDIKFKTKLLNQKIQDLIEQKVTEKEFNKIVEHTAQLLKIDTEPVYRINYFNFLLRKTLKKARRNWFSSLTLNNDLQKLIEIYDLLDQPAKNNSQLTKYMLTKPKILLSAIYLKTIEKGNLF